MVVESTTPTTEDMPQHPTTSLEARRPPAVAGGGAAMVTESTDTRETRAIPQHPTTSLEARRPPADAGGGAAAPNPFQAFLANAAAGKYGQPRVAARRTSVPRPVTSQPPPLVVTQPVPPPTAVHPVPPPFRSRVEEEGEDYEEHEEEEDETGLGWRRGFWNLEALDPSITKAEYEDAMGRTCGDTLRGHACKTLTRCVRVPNCFFACKTVNKATKGGAITCQAPFKHVGEEIELFGNPRGPLKLTLMYANIVPTCKHLLRRRECTRLQTQQGCAYGHDFPETRLSVEASRRWQANWNEVHHELIKGKMAGKSLQEMYMDDEL